MIKQVVTDVDGVLTDGCFYYTEEGKVMKKFGPHDGDGVKMIRALGIEVYAISADHRGFPITKRRLDDMKVDIQLVSEADRFSHIQERFGFEETIFIGDGVHDAPVLKKVKYGFAPADATKEALNSAINLKTTGGRGVLLEVAKILEFWHRQGRL